MSKNEISVKLADCEFEPRPNQESGANLFISAIELASAKLKRVVTGTHSFEIDRDLAGLLPKHGWDSEGVATRVTREANQPVIVHDGIQDAGTRVSES